MNVKPLVGNLGALAEDTIVTVKFNSNCYQTRIVDLMDWKPPKQCKRKSHLLLTNGQAFPLHQQPTTPLHISLLSASPHHSVYSSLHHCTHHSLHSFYSPLITHCTHPLITQCTCPLLPIVLTLWSPAILTPYSIIVFLYPLLLILGGATLTGRGRGGTWKSSLQAKGFPVKIRIQIQINSTHQAPLPC